MVKKDRRCLTQTIAKASQENGRARAAGSDNRLGKHDDPILVDDQPLDSDGGVHQKGLLHNRRSARGKELSCPSSMRGGKLVRL
jgi:hypothetical protein